jgi:hypothetical protein
VRDRKERELGGAGPNWEREEENFPLMLQEFEIDLEGI